MGLGGAEASQEGWAGESSTRQKPDNTDIGISSLKFSQRHCEGEGQLSILPAESGMAGARPRNPLSKLREGVCHGDTDHGVSSGCRCLDTVNSILSSNRNLLGGEARGKKEGQE